MVLSDKKLTNDELADFLQRACVQLVPELTAQLLSMAVELIEYKQKIEQGTLIELPCVIVGNGAIDAFGKVRVPYYQVLWLDEFGFMKIFRTTDHEEAEKRLKELQE